MTEPEAARLLTEAELELMNVLWDRGPSTARDVVDALPDTRAYTTIGTILHILESKGFVRSEKEGRALRYAPALDRAPYQERNLRRVVDTVFQGDRVELVRRLVGEARLDPAELAELRALVDGLDP